MIRFGVILGVILSSASAQANWLPLRCQWSAHRMSTSTTPRGEELAELQRRQSYLAATHRLARLADRELTDTQDELRAISPRIDEQLSVGDIGPLITKFEAQGQQVETAYLAFHKNLESIQWLRQSLDAKDPNSLLAGLEALGLDSNVAKGIINEGDTQKIRTLLQGFAKQLERENVLHAKTLVKVNTDEFAQVRKHTQELLKASPAQLLDFVDRVDNRFTVKTPEPKAPAPETEGAEAVKPELVVAGLETVAKTATKAARKPDYRETKKKVHETVDLIKQNLTTLDEHLYNLMEGDSTKLGDLKKFLADQGYMRADLLPLLAGAKRDKAVQMELLENLVHLRGRVADTETILRNALKLEARLGLFGSDSDDAPHVLPKGFNRPTHEDLRNFLTRNGVARKAMASRDRSRQVMAALDSTVLLGFLSKTVPALADGTGAILNIPFKILGKDGVQLPAASVRAILKPFYDELIIDHHYPSLSILKRVPGKDGSKLIGTLETLAARTGDDLLVTFARRVDLVQQWANIKEEAEKRKDSDHLKLFERMEKAEKIAQHPLMPKLNLNYRDGRSRRLIVAGIEGLTLIIGGSQYLLSETLQEEEPSEEAVPETENKPEPPAQ